MKISRTRFVIIFLVSAFAFSITTNLLLQPVNGDWFAGTSSPIAWKRNVATIIYPVKIVLVGPLAPIFNDPDPAPPIRGLACAIYWTVIALVLHFLLSKMIPVKSMNRIEELYGEAKADEWFKRFAVFCRIALAASFIPAGYIKIVGERFAAGLPSNNPLGHYFDALQLTGYYYAFIGIAQIITAVLLLIPRTALLGALFYFFIIVNICVLTYATRFDGTRIVTLLVLTSVFLLIWDYDRLKYILPLKPPETKQVQIRLVNKRLRLWFFGGSFALVALIIIGTFYLFEIVPGNSEAECRNQCAGSKNPRACQAFCDCIYKQGRPLDSCLAKFNKTK